MITLVAPVFNISVSIVMLLLLLYVVLELLPGLKLLFSFLIAMCKAERHKVGTLVSSTGSSIGWLLTGVSPEKFLELWNRPFYSCLFGGLAFE